MVDKFSSNKRKHLNIFPIFLHDISLFITLLLYCYVWRILGISKRIFIHLVNFVYYYGTIMVHYHT